MSHLVEYFKEVWTELKVDEAYGQMKKRKMNGDHLLERNHGAGHFHASLVTMCLLDCCLWDREYFVFYTVLGTVDELEEYQEGLREKPFGLKSDKRINLRKLLMTEFVVFECNSASEL